LLHLPPSPPPKGKAYCGSKDGRFTSWWLTFQDQLCCTEWLILL
jgi:hypothetical protein